MIHEFYSERIKELDEQYRCLKQRYNRIATFRLLIVIAAAIIAYMLWDNDWWQPSVVITIALAAFLRLVAISTTLKHELANLQTLLSINKEEIEALNGNYTHRYDGTILQPAHHAYAQDLDILGKASVFQYIHRTTSEQGHQLLAGWLLHPADKTTIEQRQQLAKALKDHTSWRQQLQAYGSVTPLTFSIQSALSIWLAQPHYFIRHAPWKYARLILPAISLSFLTLHIAGIVQAPLFYGMLFVFLVASGYISKLVTPQYHQLSKHITQMQTLAQSLQWIEKCPASLELPGLAGSTASGEVRELKKILDRMDYRLNPPVFILLNIFLYWDLQQVLQLEQWKAQHKDKLNDWFNAIAQAETLSSLANVSFNHPGWTFPAIRPDWFKLVCQEAGHPLIMPSKSVNNSFTMEGHPQLAFITGSNMAGKSTFLRTIGANLVLAMAGAPVCATRFETPVLNVMTSMRIADNLEESASTFYAELQKLKMVLDAVKLRHSRVFLLLDEILRGTNSLDRHTGSEALIRQLIREDAVAIIASHDLSLTKLQEEYPTAIHNYHFDVTITGNELNFDYKLKEGVCQTLNATLLMRKIGIEV